MVLEPKGTSDNDTSPKDTVEGQSLWICPRSTTDQDLSIQEAALEAAGCFKIFAEKKSGTRRDGRTELQVLLECVREGDTVVVTRIDRLARSMRDLQNIVHELRENGVALKATEQPIDTSSAAGKAFLDMLGIFAEFETNLRRERQLEGIEKAKREGIYKGRPAKLDADHIKSLRASGMGPAQIAKELKVSRSSVYRLLD
jgi:DNA invertase Pin-like site-specific DNA recombinase